MTPPLHELAAWLQRASCDEVASKVYVDTGALLERDHAQEAGFGFVGKNTMLIQPHRGSFFFLGELLTTVALTADTVPKQMPSCGSCTRCLTACPTNAFPQPYVLDARRCISYLTIEHKGAIPRELRPLMGNWIYGCDICQDVCPFNRFAPEPATSHFQAADVDAAAPSLLDLLALDAEQFQQRFAQSPIKRIGRSRLLRNACVAAGNWGSVTAVPALSRVLNDDEPLLREHAAWALGRIATPESTAALAARLVQEEDEAVRAEITAALNV
jgi:epoxyqueuosine reductase